MDLDRLRRDLNNQIYIASMRPVFNKRALFTDTTEDYVYPAEPEPFEEVSIRFRTGKNNVDRVFLMSGGKAYLMTKVRTEESFDYYEYTVTLGEEKFSYYFCNFFCNIGVIHCIEMNALNAV